MTRTSMIQPLARTLVAMCGMALVSGLSGVATAQVQDGRALERNQRVGGQNEAFSRRPSMADEVRLRNALVTGNVGGGRAFRGDVGYVAPGDFGARLGSDSTFSFRRDSASAAQVTNPMRRVDSLRWQFGGATGVAGSSAAMGDGVISRVGASGAAAAMARPGSTDLLGSVGADSFRPRPGTLRSTGAYAASTGLGDALVGYEATDRGYAPITASPLLGVRRVGLGATQGAGDVAARGATGLERPAPSSLSSPLTSPISGAVGEGTTRSTGAAVQRQDLAVRTLADDLRDRMDQRARDGDARPGDGPGDQPGDGRDDQRRPGERGDGPAPVRPGDVAPPADERESSARSREAVEERLRSLRERLVPTVNRLDETGRRARDQRDRDAAQRARTQGQGDRPDERGTEQPGARRDETGAPEDPRQRASAPLDLGTGIDPDTLRMIREAGGQARQFVDPTTGKRDLYAEQMFLGQDLLGKQRYFDAEERFAAALAVRPGDATAQAARLHAQLGAGLYLSAAVNLRQLVTAHPELLGLRYTGATIPPVDRLGSVAADLRTNLRRAIETNQTPNSGDGLLLAYIGWQVGDRAAIEEGLDGARRGFVSTPGATPAPEDVALLELLAGVWLAPPADSSPAPASNP